MTTLAGGDLMQPMTGNDRIIVVSGDSHAGPRLREDLRPYCPRQHLGDYDAWVIANSSRATAEFAEDGHKLAENRHRLVVAGLPYEQEASNATLAEATNEALVGCGARMLLNHQTRGHFDIQTRIAEMDYDG